MRRILLGVVLGALLTIMVAAPAGAVPPNEILIAKNLQRLGVVPGYATPAMARAAAQAAAAKGTDHAVKPAAGKACAEQVARPLPHSTRGHRQGARAPTRRTPWCSSSSSAPTRGPTATPPATTWTARRTARSRRRRPTTTPRSGRATSARCTTSRCCSATRIRSMAPSASSERQQGRDEGRGPQRAAVRDAGARHQRRHDAQLLPGAVARRLHGAGRHQGLGHARPARVLLRRRQRPVELHRRPHRPRLEGRARRHRQVRRGATPTSTGRSTTGRTRGASPARTSTSRTATSTT